MVYYANYLKFMERGRTEWLRALGLSQAALKAESGRVFVVTRCEIDFRRPARMDDRLSVATRLVAARRASLTLAQTVVLEERSASEDPTPPGAALAEATVAIACLDASGRPTRLPETIGFGAAAGGGAA